MITGDQFVTDGSDDGPEKVDEIENESGEGGQRGDGDQRID